MCSRIIVSQEAFNHLRLFNELIAECFSASSSIKDIFSHHYAVVLSTVSLNFAM